MARAEARMRMRLKILMRASWRGTLEDDIVPPAVAKSRGAWDPRVHGIPGAAQKRNREHDSRPRGESEPCSLPLRAAVNIVLVPDLRANFVHGLVGRVNKVRDLAFAVPEACCPAGRHEGPRGGRHSLKANRIGDKSCPTERARWLPV